MNSEFFKELSSLLNKHSIENCSNTPDYILSEFIKDVLNAWNRAVILRDRHFDNDHSCHNACCCNNTDSSCCNDADDTDNPCCN